jgi:hypothetical protein
MRLKNSVVVHQPHFLPWPPYLAKLALCETFVVQDDVLYRKGYFQNRTRILNRRGTPVWLTLPVHSHSVTTIKATPLDYSNQRLIWHIRNVLEDSYCRSPFFSSIWPAVSDFIRSVGSGENLMLLNANIASIMLLFTITGLIPPKIVFASHIPNTANSRTERLLDLIEAVGADKYLTGWGASLSPEIHDVGMISRHGVQVIGFDKTIATSLQPEFLAVNGVSTLHWLFQMNRADVTNSILSYAQATIKIGDSGGAGA